MTYKEAVQRARDGAGRLDLEQRRNRPAVFRKADDVRCWRCEKLVGRYDRGIDGLTHLKKNGPVSCGKCPLPLLLQNAGGTT